MEDCDVDFGHGGEVVSSGAETWPTDHGVSEILPTLKRLSVFLPRLKSPRRTLPCPPRAGPRWSQSCRLPNPPPLHPNSIHHLPPAYNPNENAVDNASLIDWDGSVDPRVTNPTWHMLPSRHLQNYGSPNIHPNNYPIYASPRKRWRKWNTSSVLIGNRDNTAVRRIHHPYTRIHPRHNF